MGHKVERVKRIGRGKARAVRGERKRAAPRQGADPHPKPSPEGEGLKAKINPFMPGLRVREEDGFTAARTRTFLGCWRGRGASPMRRGWRG